MNCGDSRRRQVAVFILLALALPVIINLLVNNGVIRLNVERTSPLHQTIPTDQGGASTFVRTAPRPAGSLRYDWTSLERLSPMAKQLAALQSNCSLPFKKFQHLPSGLGSQIHVQSRFLCYALEQGQFRLRSLFPNQWLDLDLCAAHENISRAEYASGRVESTNSTTGATTVLTRSSISCFFTKAEPFCPQDYNITSELDSQIEVLREYTDPKIKCNADMTLGEGMLGISMSRGYTVEFFFTAGLSPMIQAEAERLLKVTFPPNGEVPPNLITIHMRWGDKGREMELQAASVYVTAVHTILEKRKEQHKHQQKAGSPKIDDRFWNASYEDVNIYLATEDINALNAFREAAPKDWNIFADDFFPTAAATNVMAIPGEASNAGVVTLALLLLSMEANTFILTTASNWSRLMNELRRTVLDPRCGNCTMFVDLVEGEWR